MDKRCMGCMAEYDNSLEECPFCGYGNDMEPGESIHLTPGSKINYRYIVGKALGSGGFGITYIGWDTLLEQKVAIKEYLPSEFSTRIPGNTQVSIMRGEKAEQYYSGLNKFVDEAKSLARFQDEPGIIRVTDAFKDNNTAYLVMEYLEGETLSKYLERKGTIPAVEAIQMLIPIMESLKKIHKMGMLHRDISPDNIYLLKDGTVKLIDFGASRFATTAYSRSLTVVVKAGYSPEEQYRSRGEQGAYTDVYALAATLYTMMTGIVPPDAMKRRIMLENKGKDPIVSPRKLVKGMSKSIENTLMNALNVRLEDRTKDVDSFLKELTSKGRTERVWGTVKRIESYRTSLWTRIAVLVALLALVISGVWFFSDTIRPVRTQKWTLTADEISVPQIEGLQIEEAMQKLSEEGLRALIAETIPSDYVPEGKIVLQKPVAGTLLERDGIVYLTVSGGSVCDQD